jgi:hypothetical protein
MLPERQMPALQVCVHLSRAPRAGKLPNSALQLPIFQAGSKGAPRIRRGSLAARQEAPVFRPTRRPAARIRGRYAEHPPGSDFAVEGSKNSCPGIGNK